MDGGLHALLAVLLCMHLTEPLADWAPCGLSPTRTPSFRTLPLLRSAHPQRFFTGSIAHLLIYNTSLTPEQIKAVSCWGCACQGGGGVGSGGGCVARERA